MIFAPVEHDMLEEMRVAGFTTDLILGANVVPDVDGNNGCFMVFMDNDR